MNSSPSPPARVRNPVMMQPPTSLARWSKSNEFKSTVAKIVPPQQPLYLDNPHDSDDTVLSYLSSSFEVPQQPIASPISSNDSGPTDFTANMEKYFIKPYEVKNERRRESLVKAIAEPETSLKSTSTTAPGRVTASGFTTSLESKTASKPTASSAFIKPKKYPTETSDSFPSMASWETIPRPKLPSGVHPPRPTLSQLGLDPHSSIDALRYQADSGSQQTVIHKIDGRSTPAYLRYAKIIAPEPEDPTMLPHAQSILDQIQDLQVQVENYKSELETFKHENETLREQLEESLEEEQEWKKMYAVLGGEKNSLESEQKALQKKNTTLKKETSTLKKETSTLKKETSTLKKETITLKKENNALENENAALKAKNAALEEKYRKLQDERNRIGEALMYEWGKQEVGPRKKADGTWGMGYRYKYGRLGGKEA